MVGSRDMAVGFVTLLIEAWGAAASAAQLASIRIDKTILFMAFPLKLATVTRRCHRAKVPAAIVMPES